MLRRRPHRAGEIAEALNLRAPLISRHLRALRDGGLVEDHHPDFDTRVRIYQLKAARFSELKAWAAEIETMWSDQLASFKAHIETGPA